MDKFVIKKYRRLQDSFFIFLMTPLGKNPRAATIYCWLSLNSYLPWLPSIHSLRSTYLWVNVIRDLRVFDSGLLLWLTLRFQIGGFVLELVPWKRILVRALSFCFDLELNTNYFLGFFFFFFFWGGIYGIFLRELSYLIFFLKFIYRNLLFLGITLLCDNKTTSS